MLLPSGSWFWTEYMSKTEKPACCGRGCTPGLIFFVIFTTEMQRKPFTCQSGKLSVGVAAFSSSFAVKSLSQALWT